jgi:hypothetical protein
MLKLKSLWLALIGGAALTASPAFAQDSKALIDALIRKGILTNDEAAQISNEVKTAQSAQDVATSGIKALKKLTLSGRFQVQYAGLSTDINGAAVQPPATNHFFLRRIYWGFKAELTDNWSGTFNYDFAGSTFDAAFVTWKQSDAFAVDVGFRKVPFVWDEFYTSSDIRAIERSPVTRYFVEGNNGRRLGAGSYRVGVYAGGTLPSGVFYSVAATDPERDESFSGVAGAGNRTTNSLAYWGNLGLANKFDGGSYRLGASIGFLPDQGGKVLGAGDNLTVYGLYGELQSGGLFLRGEYVSSDNEHGASATRDAKSWGYYVMPCYKVGNLEGVVRYSYLDSDGRGVDLGDGVRSAPSGGTMNKMSEWFIGGHYYFHGNDTKLQLGYIRAESKDTLAGGTAKATTEGVRSQLQLNF